MRPSFVSLVMAGDRQADRVVPPSGFTARLTVFAAAAMAFLAVFALALAAASGRLAERWGSELAQSATIRISAPADQRAEQTAAALRVLETTPGVASSRALSDEELAALLAPWFGSALPVDDLPLPRLIEVVQGDEGIDVAGLRLRLAAEVPGAVFDDHARWRAPLVAAADRLRGLGILAAVLIAATVAAMVTLAANAALAANAQVISVLRHVGATDNYIALAFVRRFTLRALGGALAGTVLGLAAIALLPERQGGTEILTGLAFQGVEWGWGLAIPLMIALVAYLATALAASRALKELS